MEKWIFKRKKIIILSLYVLGGAVLYFTSVYIEEWKKDARGERFSNDNLEPIFPIKSFIVIPRENAERFEEYAQEKGYFNRPISKDEKQELLDYVNNILRMRQKKDKNKPYSDLPRAIRELDLR